jgi:hypothetical protein
MSKKNLFPERAYRPVTWGGDLKRGNMREKTERGEINENVSYVHV